MGVRGLGLLVFAACSAKSAAPPTASPAQPTRAVSPAVDGGATGGTSPLPSTPAPAPAPVSPSPPTSNATLAEVGLDATSLDRTVDPCVDFYQFACGGWLAANPIPAGRTTWSRLQQVDEKTKATLATLLDQAAAKNEPATEKLGNFYASCMDEAAIEKAGTAALKPLLDRTLKVKDARSWLRALTGLHQAGVWAVFGSSTGPDPESSSIHVTQLDASGLGLPDRDYYVQEAFKDQLDGYRQHVARMLALVGVANAEAAAADAVAIETELARLTKTMTERRNVQAAHNPTNLKQLAKQTKTIDWRGYYKALGIKPTAKINVGTPKFFAGLDAIRKRFKPARWSGYFTYHLLKRTAIALPKAFGDEAFALDKLVMGVAEPQPRTRRCVDATSSMLGELLGRAYVEKHFSPAAKQLAITLFDTVTKVMHDEIGQLDWMTDATKQAAQTKLSRLVRMVGYPERWRSYDFEVKRDDFAGNLVRGATFETRRVLLQSGRPVERNEGFMNTFTVDASYSVSANSAVIPAGVLQPPLFGVDRAIAANLGGIGMVISHELTHGFDDMGAQFDASGNVQNWWHAEDKAKFEDKGRCVAKMYDSFEALPKQFVNGTLTLGENIADLGGVKLAFKAYRTLRKDAARPLVADGFTEDQQFFIAVGQAWCGDYRPAELRRRLATDPHAPPKFRVFGALRNLPGFSQAFQCAPGTPMHPAQTCSVW